MQQPTYEQMAADFQPQIEAGHQARTTVIKYADWLVTTINEAIPQENWVLPSPHPSSLLIQNVQNFNDDYQALANSLALVCMDVETNPGPNARETQLVSTSKSNNVSFGKTALLELRKRATKRPNSVMETLKITVILRSRGCRAGKNKPARCNKIPTVPGKRNTDNTNHQPPMVLHGGRK